MMTPSPRAINVMRAIAILTNERIGDEREPVAVQAICDQVAKELTDLFVSKGAVPPGPILLTLEGEAIKVDFGQWPAEVGLDE